MGTPSSMPPPHQRPSSSSIRRAKFGFTASQVAAAAAAASAAAAAGSSAPQPQPNLRAAVNAMASNVLASSQQNPPAPKLRVAIGAQNTVKQYNSTSASKARTSAQMFLYGLSMEGDDVVFGIGTSQTSTQEIAHLRVPFATLRNTLAAAQDHMTAGRLRKLTVSISPRSSAPQALPAPNNNPQPSSPLKSRAEWTEWISGHVDQNLGEGQVIFPQVAQYPPIGLPGSTTEHFQNICNLLLMLSVYRVVWYFYPNKELEFAADVTSVTFEGLKPRIMARVYDAKTKQYSRPMMLEEAYECTAHALGLNIKTKSPVDMTAVPTAEEVLYPNRRGYDLRHVLRSIFVVTHFRGANPEPLWKTKGALTMNDLLSKVCSLARRSGSRKIDYIMKSLSMIRELHVGKLSYLVCNAGKERPAELHLSEMQALVASAPSLKKFHSRSKPCWWVYGKQPIAPELAFRLEGKKEEPEDISQLVDAARSKQMTDMSSLRAATKKARNDAKGGKAKQAAAKAQQYTPEDLETMAIEGLNQQCGYCVCSFGSLIPAKFHTPLLITGAVVTRMDACLQKLKPEERQKHKRLAKGLACFPAIEFPMLQPPVCWNEEQKRHVFLTAAVISKAIRDPESFDPKVLNEMKTAETEMTPEQLRKAMVAKGEKYRRDSRILSRTAGVNRKRKASASRERKKPGRKRKAPEANSVKPMKINKKTMFKPRGSKKKQKKKGGVKEAQEALWSPAVVGKVMASLQGEEVDEEPAAEDKDEEDEANYDSDSSSGGGSDMALQGYLCNQGSGDSNESHAHSLIFQKPISQLEFGGSILADCFSANAYMSPAPVALRGECPSDTSSSFGGGRMSFAGMDPLPPPGGEELDASFCS